MRHRWIPFIAIGIALLLFGGASGGTFVLTGAFFCFCFFMVGLGVWLHDRKGKDDLGVLQEVHEKQIVREIEIDEPNEYDSVHCLGCGETYAPEFRACPRCGRSC